METKTLTEKVATQTPTVAGVAKTNPNPTNDARKQDSSNTAQAVAIKKLSVIDAAFKVLSESADSPLSCSQLIEKMAKAGYWKPNKGGKTPANTLSAALLREIKTKGDESRFEKVARGQFGIKKAD